MLFDPTAVNFVMNVMQAASYLGVPSDVIENLVKQRTIPFTRIGERVVFSKTAIDQWVYARSMENLSEDLPALGFHGKGGL
jgi:excisionase family DNA binding protein